MTELRHISFCVLHFANKHQLKNTVLMIACERYCNETGGGGMVEEFWRVCGEHYLLFPGGVTALLWERCDLCLIVVMLEVPVASLFPSESGTREWQQLKSEHADCPRCKHTTFVPARCNFYILECWVVWKRCFLATEGIFFGGHRFLHMHILLFIINTATLAENHMSIMDTILASE